MGEEKVSIDYEREYKRLLAQIANTNEEHKQQLQEKDEELKWYKKVINGILHI